MGSFISLMGTDVEVVYGDKTYKLAPLRFKEVAEYLLWYQYRELEVAKETTKNLPEELKRDILRATHEECKNKRWVIKDTETGDIVKETFLSWETPEVQESLNTPSGISQQVYLALKINHPEMTLDLANRICQLETYEKILNKVHEALGLTPEKIITAGETLPGELIPNQ
jgi:hypothetical protein